MQIEISAKKAQIVILALTDKQVELMDRQMQVPSSSETYAKLQQRIDEITEIKDALRPAIVNG